MTRVSDYQVTLPCRFCGRLVKRRVRHAQHEERCPRNPDAAQREDGRPLEKDAYRRWQHDQSIKRLEELFARVDLTAYPGDIQRRLLELGVPSVHAARRLVARAVSFGIIPRNVQRGRSSNAHETRERYNEYVREFFKDPTVRLDRPLAPQVVERGGKRGSAQNMAKRARELGIIPPGHRFPNQEPRDLLRHPDGWKNRVRPTRPPREAKPKPPSSPKAPPNARERDVPSGFSNGPKSKPAKYQVTRSALDGDGVKKPCPLGCGESFNAFRMTKHLDQCPMRDEEEEDE